MCEDYPCCGHEAGECGMTREDQRARDAHYYAMMMREEEDEYGYDLADY